MGKYISEFCQEIHNYIYNQRVNYGSGSKLFNYIDKDSFTKYFLTMEFFDNMDVWASSTYLYKPAGENKLYAGPVWDCDSIMGVRFEEKTPTVWKFRSFGKDLMGTPAFRKALKEVYVKEVRPVIQDTLLGDTDGKYLKTYEDMKAEVSASLAMNDMIWEQNNLDGTYFHEETAEENYDSLYSLMVQRAQWLDEEIMADDFVQNKVVVNKAKAPKLTANHKKNTIKVTITKTNYKISNLTGSKQKKATNYQIAYRVKGTNTWKTVKTNGKLNYTLKKLKNNKTYEVKVRAIAKTSTTTKYGTYSKIKTVKVK